VIQFHDVLVHDSILTRDGDVNRVKIPESILSQKMKLNYQLEDHDHIHAQIQFQERDNLTKCQCGSQNFNFGQVQIGVMKLNLGFQNIMILGSGR